MTVIEFCGNPGCGKTTLSAQLLENLRESGKRAFDYNDIKERNRIRNLRSLLTPKGLRLASALFRFGCGNRFSRHTLVYSVKCAVIVEQIQRWSERSEYDAVLFDEGIIQYITTLFHGADIPCGAIQALPFLHGFYQNKDLYVADCTLRPEENAARLRYRGREGDRFLLEDAEEQIRLLAVKRSNIDRVIEEIRPRNLLHVSTESGSDAASAIQRWVYPAPEDKE